MDQFYIIRILGRGSEGNVILAQHKTSHEYCAIKRMEWHTLEEANLHLQEANRMKKLKHRHIVQYRRVFLHKYSKETQFVCICLEYCEGGDLFRLIERARKKRDMRMMNALRGASGGTSNQDSGYSSPSSPVLPGGGGGGGLSNTDYLPCLDENDILRYTGEICQGLAYLHENNIIHRDLKPHNILLTADNTVKICDFGFSRELNSNSILANTQCGTPCYMSWEMLKGQSYDAMTDMYSLGIVVLQMMTGRSLMMSIEFTRNPQFFEELKRYSGYSPQLIDLVARLVSVDPQNRPSAQECYNMIRAIQKYKRGGQIDLEDHMALKDFNKLSQDLKLRVFTFLDCYDIYQLMCSSYAIYELCENHWWELFCRGTRIGRDILKMTAKVKRGYSGREDLENNLYKERVYLFVKYYRKQRRRAISNMGKNVVSELLPNQIDEAVDFLTTCLLLNQPKIGDILLNGMSPFNDEPGDNLTPGGGGAGAVQHASDEELGTSIRLSRRRRRPSVNRSPVSPVMQASSAPSPFRPLPPRIDLNGGDGTKHADEHVSDLHVPSSPSSSTGSLSDAEAPSSATGSARDSFGSGIVRQRSFMGRLRSGSAMSIGSATGTSGDDKVSQETYNRLKFIIRCIILLGIKYGRVFCSNRYAANGYRELVGASVWQHPYSSSTISLKKILRCGGKHSFKELGLVRTWRMFRFVERFDRARRQVIDDRNQPHWTLLLCGVKPEWQRKGIGASVLLPILKLADETALPVLTNLYFPNLESVKFFKRHGFEVAKKFDDPSLVQSGDPPYWILIRHAGG